MQTKTITTIEELAGITREVLSLCRLHEGAQVVTLSGDLGAGKTAFVKELAKQVGIQHEITSPTFVIMKSYPVTNFPPMTTLTHIDAYRIESDDEMRVLGFDALIQTSGTIVCIEWPEKISGLIPSNAIPVTLALNTDGTRTISYGR